MLPFYTRAQETVVRKNRLTSAVKEYITVIKDDPNTKHGLYKAMLDKDHPLAIGAYNHNVKTGAWSFYDDDAHLLQRYDYTHHLLLFEAPEDTSSQCRYFVDHLLKPGDTTTRPVRIGDRFYGYINYLKLFKLPKELIGVNPNIYQVSIELLVSPGGRLADYAIHFTSPVYEPLDYHLNIDLLSEEDKLFIPATINSEPVACRILIRCQLTGDGKLDLAD